MHRLAKPLPALAPLALLAACGGGDEAPAPPATPTPTTAATTPATPTLPTPVAYDCLPAQNLVVSYDNSGATPTATLSLDGATYRLSSVPAASGARYSTDEGRTGGKTLVWWTQGQDGTLYEGDVGGTADSEQQIAECSPSAG